MTKLAPALVPSPREAKVEKRRNELADAAVETLAELGFTQTSIRDIAQRTTLTHGVVHYYFADKFDLLGYGVLRYKKKCATRYDDAIADALTPEDVARSFAKAMRRTLETEPNMHRLWYDMRTQSLYNDALLATALEIDEILTAMIWRVAEKCARLAQVDVETQTTPQVLYASLDGCFQRCLLQQYAGVESAGETIENLAYAQMITLISER